MTKEDAACAAERCWALYQDPASRCYRFMKAGKPWRVLLPFSVNTRRNVLGTGRKSGTLTGVCELYFEQETRYLG
jgi:hypothetical protein